MPRAPKRRRYMLEEDLDSASEAQGLLGAQVPEAAEDDASSSSSTTSSSFPSSFPSSSSCNPLSFSPPSTPEEFFPVSATLNPSLSSLSVSCPLPAPISTPLSQSMCQEMEVSHASPALPHPEPLPRYVIDDNVCDLMGFLLLKYRTKELTTKAEMLSRVIRECQDHFCQIFCETSECLQLLFGIDVKEVDSINHVYVLGTTLGLTYDGMGRNMRSMPKTGLLVLILCIIFMEGDRAPEEAVWEKLRGIGVYAGREHYIYGEPRELITIILVQEQYLVYQQVPNSDPARYEFLWGPRAHAETTKLKVLEFLAETNGRDPRSFPVWHEEALRDQEERTQAGIATDMASASSRAMPSGFSRQE
ncbi:PREDICTED: melanoma-associated antigen 10-like [Hipposideros armiger]|uniref:Melanoma-associated antigen 10-like n=1 Tax=Hipposideros armiger TaxID=186990 RepID=A0A8B7T2C6_HIPAR|nr:PREDICTED: melanoma-associated antigen 10-like [Hipposideros armiger]